jgi:hypothetical protein
MRRIYGVLPLLAGLLAAPGAARSQADARPEVLVLGTYHMANPGRDVHNVEADDVLSPRRQRELDQLVELLARFRPTKIAIESDPGGPRPAQYVDYLAGRYTLTRNEIDQIGFRLARRLGHRAIYPVDADGDFPYLRVRNYAQANGLAERFAALEAGTGARAKAQGDFLRAHTVLETLQVMNADSTVARDVAAYLAWVPFGERYEYAGPDLLAAWYQRNIRIYHNIRALMATPEDRVLVVYGAGHLGWLRQDAANDATVRLRRLADLPGPR